MNLEIKHLSPYTPFRVKGISTITGIVSTITGFNDRNSIVTHGDYAIGGFDTIKLLLYPLSTLTTYRDDLGFVPRNKLSDSLLMQIDILSMPNILDIKVSDYNKLLEWHFDIFNLIPQNLAIDITTLN